MTAEQVTSASTALTSAIGAVMETFVQLLPIIAVTTGAIFGIRFVKSRFREVRHAG